MNRERAKRLLRMFAEEIEDHLGSLSTHLLALERGEDPARTGVDEVFRSFHTLKGSARALGAAGLEAICHRLEDELSEVRAGSRPMDRKLCAVLIKSLDAIRAVKSRSIELPAEDPLVAGLLEDIDAALNDAALGFELPTAGAEPPKPAPVTIPPPPVVSIAPAPVASAPVAPASVAPAPAAPAPIAPPPLASVTISQFPVAPPAVPAEPPPPVAIPPAPSQEFIRVTAGKLDNLMNRVGELLITRIKTAQRVTDLDGAVASLHRVQSALSTARRDEAAWAQADDALRDLDRRLLALQRMLTADIGRMALVSREVEDDVRALRLLPFSEGVGIFQRMVRDTAQALGKEVNLRIEGGDTQVDKGILEGLRDPIIHLLNNAIDHGIETREVRIALGKARAGVVRVSARQRGGRFIVEVADDGRGIDVDGVRAHAGRSGLVPIDRLASLSREECLDLLFKPGFTTTTEVTRISGRGVGMDAVREAVTRLHGTCELTTVARQGTVVTLSLPLTLITTQALLVRCDAELLAIPTSAVERTLELPADALVKVDSADAVRVDGHPVAAVRLSRVLDVPPLPAGGPPPPLRVVLLADGPRRVAILVDDIEGEQEIVHKTLGRQYVRVRHVSGATILGTGRVVVILNPQDIISTALEVRTAA